MNQIRAFGRLIMLLALTATVSRAQEITAALTPLPSAKQTIGASKTVVYSLRACYEGVNWPKTVSLERLMIAAQRIQSKFSPVPVFMVPDQVGREADTNRWAVVMRISDKMLSLGSLTLPVSAIATNDPNVKLASYAVAGTFMAVQYLKSRAEARKPNPAPYLPHFAGDFIMFDETHQCNTALVLAETDAGVINLTYGGPPSSTIEVLPVVPAPVKALPGNNVNCFWDQKRDLFICSDGSTFNPVTNSYSQDSGGLTIALEKPLGYWLDRVSNVP